MVQDLSDRQHLALAPIDRLESFSGEQVLIG